MDDNIEYISMHPKFIRTRDNPGAEERGGFIIRSHDDFARIRPLGLQDAVAGTRGGHGDDADGEGRWMTRTI